jgi:N-acetylgalactosamine-N,N'-diacetylbacillosaminyl-diphospho-undecaprenol 4-alpha-N-acetylgalactosaminyltransferase
MAGQVCGYEDDRGEKEVGSGTMEMGKMKLLFCIQDLRGRGAEKVLATLLNKFNRDNYHLGVFVYHDTFTVKIPPDVDLLSAHLLSYPASAGLFTILRMNIKKIIAQGKVLRIYEPDIVLSVSGTNITLVIAKYLFKRTSKIILSEHTMPSAFTRESRWIIKFFTRTFISLMYPRADVIVVPSKAVADDLFLHYRVSQEKIRVIPNPLDIEQVQDAANAQPAFHFPDDGSFRVGFVGGLSREKNVGCLLKAFAMVKRKGTPVRLFLVGDGDERETLINLTKELFIGDAVHFLGYQENPYALMKKFDALVVPSFYETFSYVVLEAMACKVPVISTKWQGSEDIYKNMENSLLVPMNDENQLADAIEKVLLQEDLRKKLVSHGYELITKYDSIKVTRQYEELINGVISKSNPNPM